MSLHDGGLPPDWAISSVWHILPVFCGVFHACHHSDHLVCLLVALSCPVSEENAVYSSHFEDGKLIQKNKFAMERVFSCAVP